MIERHGMTLSNIKWKIVNGLRRKKRLSGTKQNGTRSVLVIEFKTKRYEQTTSIRKRIEKTAILALFKENISFALNGNVTIISRSRLTATKIHAP